MATSKERRLADSLSFLRTEDAKRRWLGVWDVLKQIPDPPDSFTKAVVEAQEPTGMKATIYSALIVGLIALPWMFLGNA